MISTIILTAALAVPIYAWMKFAHTPRHRT